MDAYYHLEQFEELEECIDKLSEKDPLLTKLAEMLASVGKYQEYIQIIRYIYKCHCVLYLTLISI